MRRSRRTGARPVPARSGSPGRRTRSRGTSRRSAGRPPRPPRRPRPPGATNPHPTGRRRGPARRRPEHLERGGRVRVVRWCHRREPGLGILVRIPKHGCYHSMVASEIEAVWRWEARMERAGTPLPGRPVRGSDTGRPIMALLDLLGRRWALRVLWELRSGPAPSFRELQSRCGGVSSSVLADRLTELREAGIVERAADGYRLSARGAELAEVVLLMAK